MFMDALAMIRAQAPDLEVDGEMTAEVALSQDLRNRFLPDSPLKGDANLLRLKALGFNTVQVNVAWGPRPDDELRHQ